MTINEQTRQAFAAAMRDYRAKKLSRRNAIKMLGALGLSATAASGLLHRANAQDGMPMPATPVLGQQANGSTTWKVAAGAMDMASMVEVSQFFPQTLTVNAGDSVYFEIMGFHNVRFTAGGDRLPLFIPNPAPATPIAGPTAAQGQPQLIFNPEIFLPGGDATAVDGTTPVNSGLPLDPTAPPPVFTFPTPGTYDYVCDIHPGMQGQIVVQEAGAAYPADQAAIDAQTQTELAAAYEALSAEIDAANAATPAADGIALVSAGVNVGQAETLAYHPAEVTIAAGGTVRWVNPSQVSPHTVTFLGGEAPVEDIIFQPSEAGPPTLVLNPNSFFPSDAPAAYNGQGFVNSGYIGHAPVFATDTFELTFDTPGTYEYYCILHAGPAEGGEGGTPAAGAPALQGMVGRVIVQ
ncbi:MAG: hypothetical protein AVDCRST_MAG73-953 [uncultured Thermomicrobiales bacterium]|uniref:Uncharacterized protein n=1 Tax=uncultured Thermomicrobiales bacterium TaxID=1645740 RepID=A0A6J4TUV5_9BACT|nr:MAG: hypothetical protein AVDCRST_MAG73-953 [uncultured Thermomicrobiales bacterium]